MIMTVFQNTQELATLVPALAIVVEKTKTLGEQITSEKGKEEASQKAKAELSQTAIKLTEKLDKVESAGYIMS